MGALRPLYSVKGESAHGQDGHGGFCIHVSLKKSGGLLLREWPCPQKSAHLRAERIPRRGCPFVRTIPVYQPESEKSSKNKYISHDIVCRMYRGRLSASVVAKPVLSVSPQLTPARWQLWICRKHVFVVSAKDFILAILRGYLSMNGADCKVLKTSY